MQPVFLQVPELAVPCSLVDIVPPDRVGFITCHLTYHQSSVPYLELLGLPCWKGTIWGHSFVSYSGQLLFSSYFVQMRWFTVARMDPES